MAPYFYQDLTFVAPVKRLKKGLPMLQPHFRKSMLTSISILALLQPAFGMWNGTESDSRSQASSSRSASPAPAAPAEATATSESVRTRTIAALLQAYHAAVSVTGALPAQKDPHLSTWIHTLLQTYALQHAVTWENFVTAMNLAVPEVSVIFQQAIAGVIDALSSILLTSNALHDEQLQLAAQQIAAILQATSQNTQVAHLFQPLVSQPEPPTPAAKKVAKPNPKAKAAEPEQAFPSPASIQRPPLSTEDQALFTVFSKAVSGFLNPQIDSTIATKLLVKTLIESALKKALLASNIKAGLILKAIDLTQKDLSEQLIAYINKQKAVLKRLMSLARLDPQALLTLLNEMTQHIADLISAHPEVLEEEDEEVVVPLAEAAPAVSVPPAMLTPAPIIKRVSSETLTLLKAKITNLKQQEPTHPLYGHALIKALIKAAREKGLIQSEHTDEEIFNQLESSGIGPLLTIVHLNIANWPDLLVAPSAHIGLLEQSVNQLLLSIAPEINAALTEESTGATCSASCAPRSDDATM